MSRFRASADLSLLYYWLGAIAFTLQIYYDFSGYSDMAIGLGRIFGFRFPENFQYPYLSGSITEFWRRWHISLGSWFRDYLYIPLGGNRKGSARQLLNILLVWLATGLWHGAAWNFVLWGLLYAVLLTAEKLFLLRGLQKLHVLNHVYVLLFVTLGFVLFDASNVQDAAQSIRAMFGGGACRWSVRKACTSCAAAPCCSCLPLPAQRRWRKACVQQSSAAEQEKRLLRFWSRSV